MPARPCDASSPWSSCCSTTVPVSDVRARRAARATGGCPRDSVLLSLTYCARSEVVTEPGNCCAIPIGRRLTGMSATGLPSCRPGPDRMAGVVFDRSRSDCDGRRQRGRGPCDRAGEDQTRLTPGPQGPLSAREAEVLDPPSAGDDIHRMVQRLGTSPAHRRPASRARPSQVETPTDSAAAPWPAGGRCRAGRRAEPSRRATRPARPTMYPPGVDGGRASTRTHGSVGPRSTPVRCRSRERPSAGRFLPISEDNRWPGHQCHPWPEVSEDTARIRSVRPFRDRRSIPEVPRGLVGRSTPARGLCGPDRSS